MLTDADTPCHGRSWPRLRYQLNAHTRLEFAIETNLVPPGTYHLEACAYMRICIACFHAMWDIFSISFCPPLSCEGIAP